MTRRRKKKHRVVRGRRGLKRRAVAAPKHTHCGIAFHEAFKESPAWKALPVHGVQDLGNGEKGEFKQCPFCPQTMCREIK